MRKLSESISNKLKGAGLSAPETPLQMLRVAVMSRVLVWGESVEVATLNVLQQAQNDERSWDDER